MKTITVKQPWATLIAEGIKTYEFRSWKTNYRGDILIHAGVSTDKKEMEKFIDFDLVFPKSRIVAIAKLEDCLEIDDELNQEIINENNIAYGSKKRTGYAWKLTNIRKLNYDKDVKGQLGLWNYEIDNDIKK